MFLVRLPCSKDTQTDLTSNYAVVVLFSSDGMSSGLLAKHEHEDMGDGTVNDSAELRKDEANISLSLLL